MNSIQENILTERIKQEEEDRIINEKLQERITEIDERNENFTNMLYSKQANDNTNTYYLPFIIFISIIVVLYFYFRSDKVLDITGFWISDGNKTILSITPLGNKFIFSDHILNSQVNITYSNNKLIDEQKNTIAKVIDNNIIYNDITFQKKEAESILEITELENALE